MDYNDNEYIGILATDEEIHALTKDDTKDSVFINGQNDIQYQIKAISDTAPTRFFTGYINSIDDSDSYELDIVGTPATFEERKDFFRKKISNYIFIFNSKTSNSKTDGKKFYKINRAILFNRPTPVSADSVFVATPVFSPKEATDSWEYKQHTSLERNYSSHDEFIEKLASGQPIGRVSHFESIECPRFIVWNDEESGRLSAIGPFTSVEYTGNSSFIFRFENLYEIDLQEYEEDYVVYAPKLNPTVIHIPESVHDTISNNFVTHENARFLCGSQNKADEASAVIVQPASEEAVIEIDPSIKDDHTLLKSFNRLCEENKLFYEPKDLSNFHTAVKSGNLVILSGMSGTGKSAIVDMYARALGLRLDDDESRFLMIPVRPAWNDDSDLLGYVDLVHMVYRASDTGFVELLVQASQNPNKMYIVCFDEMNLARVEHYFSQFLSILEKPDGYRILHLYDDQYNLYNASQYPSKIELKGNIRFVGTVNIDESTYHFADKVLDRANVINLHVRPFDQWDSHRYTTKQIQEWSYTEYKAITRTEDNIRSTEIKQFLWDLHVALQTTSNSFGIGPRVVKSIERYIANLPVESSEFDISVAYGLDIQVKQRILTKLRGTSEKFGDLFTENENSILAVFEKYSSLSEFSESKQEVIHKQKELKIYGYCF